MKKTVIFLVTLGMIGGLTAKLSAAEQKTQLALHVAVVDFQRAINETEAGKKAEQNLNAALAEKKKKFDILKQELETMRQDFEKQRLVLSGKPLEDKRDALQKKLSEVEQTGMNYEQEMAQKKADALKNIVVGLQQVVQQIGSQEKFDFIFEKSQGAVLYSPTAEDITDRVIKTYNAHPAK